VKSSFRSKSFLEEEEPEEEEEEEAPKVEIVGEGEDDFL